MKPLFIFLYGLSLGLLASAIIFLLILPPKGQGVELSPIPTQVPYRVDISGQVKQPGVYSLPKGSRLEDVIKLAGGLSPNADTTSINLAKKILDGEKIYIPYIGQIPVHITSLSLADAPTINSVNPLDINSASKEQFELLPGIGPKIAEAIINYRDEHGTFHSCEELKNVHGIGEAIFNQISGVIIVR